MADKITVPGHSHLIEYSDMLLFCLNARLLAFGYGTKVATVIAILGQETLFFLLKPLSSVIQPGKDGLAFSVFRG